MALVALTLYAVQSTALEEHTFYEMHALYIELIRFALIF